MRPSPRLGWELACLQTAAFAPRIVTRRLLPLLLLVIALPLCGRAAPGPSADLSGLSITTDYANQETIFTGDARLSDGETLLEADEIRYRLDTGIAIATGNVRFTRGAQRILADQITYRRSDQSFTLSQVKLGRYPFYVAGASASGTPDRITVQDATVSVREPGPYQPTVVAESLTYTDNREISAEQAHLGIGRLQPLSLPKFSHRLNLPFISYVSLSAGYRSSLGLFGEAGAHVPLGPETKVGGTVGVYTQRGLMFGPSAHYELERDGREISGDLKSGFINDHGEKLTDVLGRPVPEERGYVQWWHAQDLTERLRLTAQLHYWKDSEILRDFRPREFFRVQEPDNFVEAVYTGSNLHASVFSRLQPNPYHRVQERLPEVRLDLLPTALGHGIYQRLSASAVRLREDPPAGSPTLLSDRLDTYYGLTRSFTPREWLGITPRRWRPRHTLHQGGQRRQLYPHPRRGWLRRGTALQRRF
jgi:LPS-assembly protein